MRRTFAGLAIAAFVVALSAPAFAATETVKGQVVDMNCYKADKSNTGVDHKMPKGDTKDCAIGCAKSGQPLALLTSDGKVYQIAADNLVRLREEIYRVCYLSQAGVEESGSARTNP